MAERRCSRVSLQPVVPIDPGPSQYPSLPALEVVSQLLLRDSEVLERLLVPHLEGALPASAGQQLAGSIPGSLPQG